MIPDDETVELVPVRKSWLKDNGINEKSLCALRVDGESMERELRHGDTILIDTNRTNISDGKIHVFVLGDELFLKYLYRGKDELRAVSKNPSHGEFTITKQEVETKRFRLIGVVVASMNWL